MNVVFRQRDFAFEEIIPPNVDFDVVSYSHRAVGGPHIATIEAKGEAQDLWKLAGKIRTPVTVFSNYGETVYWGWVAEVRATIADRDDNAVGITVSIDGMANRIAVAYIKVDASTGSQERDTTAWADDTLSQDEYGIKELLWGNAAATQTHAERARDTRLVQDKYPKKLIEPGIRSGQSMATLTCRGWWETLGWRYYANAGTATVDTAAQIKTICSEKGQFFGTAIFQDVTSGIEIRETRDGDATALFEVEELLSLGTTNDRRMLTSVDPYRTLTIYEEPTFDGFPHFIDAEGVLYNHLGIRARQERSPAGIWVRYRDVIPQNVGSVALSSPDPFFVEEMEYFAPRDGVPERLVPRSRGDLDPWKFAKVRDG